MTKESTRRDYPRRSQGDGPALQERLKQWAAGRASYTPRYERCLNRYESYLSHSDPVVLALNPFCTRVLHLSPPSASPLTDLSKE
ncbi:hypothetical protein EV363DRAFT_1176003 [Boletus edulis]|nr:hypothetical protein EV363DRAFT_1176003 [Boletus edulis]